MAGQVALPVWVEGKLWLVPIDEAKKQQEQVPVSLVQSLQAGVPEVSSPQPSGNMLVSMADIGSRMREQAMQRKRRAKRENRLGVAGASVREQQVDGKDAKAELSMLDRAVQWIRENFNENTTKAYRAYQEQFSEFCKATGCEADSAAVVMFMRELQLKGLSIGTINRTACSAIADQFRFEERKPTESPLVKAAKLVIKRTAKPPSQKKPVTAEMLVKLCQKAPDTWLGVRNMTLLLVMATAALRRSEAVALRADDVKLDRVEQEECVAVFVAKAKNDPERRGHMRLLACACMDEMEPRSLVCVVEWVKRWFKLRDPTAERFFYVGETLEGLALSTPTSILKKSLKAIGVSDTKAYASQSLRAGGVTEASANGVDVAVLKRHGNWKSDAVFTYIRPSRQTLLSVSKSMFASVAKSSSSANSEGQLAKVP